jgi:hypothetical protein
MKIKPKEIFVNLPIVLLFQDYHEIPSFAANVNRIIHGKVKMKYEELGLLNGQYVGIFYIQRNDEYHQIRNEFVNMINLSEMGTTVTQQVEEPGAEYNPNYGDDKRCLCGHTYYRHFDSYDEMAPIGCKYCQHYDDGVWDTGHCSGFLLDLEVK